MIELRPYQQEAVDAIFSFWQRGGGNPLADIATGLGKSVIIARLTRDVLTQYRDMRVLALVHVQELVEQNYRALMRHWPDANAGIYSAGLGRRDAHHKITFASIQSVFRKGKAIGPRDLVLIDEAHLVPKAGDGMYRTLLEELRDQRPDLRIAGFTATAFRLDSGRLDQGDDRIFDEIVYSYDIGAGITDGWLSPLISKASATEIDVSGVARRGGEFVPGSLEAAADKDALTRAAARELVKYGADRRSWLIFCSGVGHAYHVRDALRDLGIQAETITGETPNGDRHRLVSAFRDGRIRCLTNAQVLTTGFDAPGVDLIAFLRPTLSTGLYLQMVGRGVRLAPDKANCLVLDFAGNVRRHGPVDAVTPPDRKVKAAGEAKAGVDTVAAKACPVCETLVGIAARTCWVCGHEWPAENNPKHAAEADNIPILSTENKNAPEMVPVVSWEASRHEKQGAPDSLRVTYFAGLRSYSEWVCFEHKGFARDKAERWWQRHGGGAPPATIDEAIERFDALMRPAAIAVKKRDRWFDVVGRRFHDQKEAAA